ncbi:MAG: hypothetical protein HRT72_06870, partial [Flavobacteriales bacterium]|nr:hypothetical protein [Flavobacteriales bacterium]
MKVTASSYYVQVGKDAFRSLENLLKSDRFEGRNIYIIADENSVLHCLPILIEEVQLLKKAGVLEIESGEENKTLDTCTDLWGALSDG